MSNTTFDPLPSLSALQISNIRNFPLEKYDKYIFHAFLGACSGLGNQMFRIAALYGIGLYPNVRRTPGITEYKKCLAEYVMEFSETFPNVIGFVEFSVSFN